MVRLSVNINKVALIRNGRGGNMPDLAEFAKTCERSGAEGITVHPRPDERHIKFSDLMPLKAVVATEFNIEGNPTDDFVERVLAVKPHQVTLVPDAPDALTSNAGWDTIRHAEFLKEVLGRFQSAGIRTSIFVDPDPEKIEAAAKLGADRVELYTEMYAREYLANRDQAIAPYVLAAQAAQNCSLGLNAGHDLSLVNLEFFAHRIPNLLEVSIGHALISDALYYGIGNVIGMYHRKLELGSLTA